jgi:alginate O-acetyltransferase complex protein AlgI
VIVSIAWVFFRADTLLQAVAYLRVLVRGNAAAPLSMLVTTVLYTRGHIVVLITAALIAFFGRQTWDLSKQVTPARAIAAMILLAASMASLATQAANPFLYFQF